MASPIKKTTGIVERVGVWELPEPKDFTYQGKTIKFTHRYALKLEGDEFWYGLGEGTKPTIDFKGDDGEYHPLGVGSEVLVKFTEDERNGKVYRNTKKTMITVLDLVPGARPSPAVKSAAKPSDSSGVNGSNYNRGGVDWAAKDAGAAASASVDKALQYLILTGQTKADAEMVLDHARVFQDMVKTLAAEILNSPRRESKPGDKSPEVAAKPKPKAAPKKEDTPAADEWRDDDIPF